MKKKNSRPATFLVSDQYNASAHSHISPLYLSSTYLYESPEKASAVFSGTEEAFIYSRWSHPNAEEVERKIAMLETYGSSVKAISLLFSSGMAAISSLFFAALKPGDIILAPGNLYGTTVDLFRHYAELYKIEVIFTDFHHPDLAEKVLRENAAIRMLYVESPANPTLSCYPMERLAALAHKYNCLAVADNTFATPILQQPLLLGFDFVIHSGTKYMNGHGTGLSGVVTGTDIRFMKQKLWKTRKLHGTIAAPFDAWLLNLGLKTLPLRMRQHSENALSLARFLENHPAVAVVHYPGLKSHPQHTLAKKQMQLFGGVLSFELKGGYKAGVRMMKKVKICKLTASLGTCDSLIQHPASMSHAFVPKAQREAFGITAGLIRLSVGLEDVQDIQDDLLQALK